MILIKTWLNQLNFILLLFYFTSLFDVIWVGCYLKADTVLLLASLVVYLHWQLYRFCRDAPSPGKYQSLDPIWCCPLKKIKQHINTIRKPFTNMALHYFCWRIMALTISPITWLSLRSVRLTPRIPNTTKTMAPVSTRGRTAGRPHTPPLHGLKPNVLDGFTLAADEGPLEIEPERNLTRVFIYSV